MKLISREVDGQAKINIYDPYVDKYYVIENESELDKLVSDDGKLIPDEQVRQYFYQKSARDKLSKRNKNGIQVRKGFTTKTANLKKEYADVQKSTFKDYIKSKIYDVYGLNLSDEDIISFNKNPTLSTIKSFKSVNERQKNHMLNIYKVNESHFNKDYEDQNNFSSLLEVLLKNKPEASQNQHTQNLLALDMVKSDVDAIGKTDNVREIQQHLQNIKNTATIVPIINTILPNNLTVENVKEYLEEINKTIDKLINSERYNEIYFNYDKSLFPKDEITWKDNTKPYEKTSTIQQFLNSKSIKGFNMEPLQSLNKVMYFIFSNELELPKEDFTVTVENEKKNDNIDVKIGDFEFKYKIDVNTPYYKSLKPFLTNYEDYIGQPGLIPNAFQEDSSRFANIKPKVKNSYEFINPYRDTASRKYSDLENINQNSVEWKMVSLIDNPDINPEEFEQYLNSVKNFKWRTDLKPSLSIENNNAEEALKSSHPFYQTEPILMLKDVQKYLDPIVEIHQTAKKGQWSKQDLKKLKTLFKATALNKFIDTDVTEDSLEYPFNALSEYWLDRFKESPFETKFTSLVDKLYEDDEDLGKKVPKTTMQDFMNSLNEGEKEIFFKNAFAFQKDLQDNIDKVYYWYYPTNENLLEDFNIIKDTKIKPDENYIQRELFNPYYYSYIPEDYFGYNTELVIKMPSKLKHNLKMEKNTKEIERIKKEIELEILNINTKRKLKLKKLEKKSDGLGMIRDMIAFKLNK